MALTELGDRLGPFAGDLEQRAVAAEYPEGDPLRGGLRAARDASGGGWPGCSARARSRATRSSPSMARAVASTSS